MKYLVNEQQKQKKIRCTRENERRKTSLCWNREITTEKKENISDWLVIMKRKKYLFIEGISQNKKMKEKYLNHKDSFNIYENSTTLETYSFIEMTNLK